MHSMFLPSESDEIFDDAIILIHIYVFNNCLKDGATAMMIAALSGYEEIVVKLLDKGADINAVAHVS